MTQVVSVSATTAAYAAEALRPNARVSGTAPLDLPTKTASGKQKKVNESAPAGSIRPVPAPALSMFLLTNSMSNRQPEVAYHEAEGAYIDNNGDEMNEGVEAEPDDGRNERLANALADALSQSDDPAPGA
ncbi:hypothetical protein [Rhizobium alvei]|uniref:Uncharacterized protein n=1 Tax=Rhizobium alvei TaxID=1132659 RepID=A0ABT8YIH9_9HYPH|nr:hypothetical protein [Rhizobium alvei]MDO6963128.1 hypothetical protein [Rhizobium alvei]